MDFDHLHRSEAWEPPSTQQACGDGPHIPHAALSEQQVRAHGKRLYLFIYRRIGQPDDAQDLVQQTWLEAMRALPRFKGESEFSTWLFGIAKNLVRNYLARSPHRRFIFVSEDALNDALCSMVSPEEICGWRQHADKLAAVFTGLPPAAREVVWMVGVEEMSYESVSEALSIPLGTVRSRLSRARVALRAQLSPMGL